MHYVYFLELSNKNIYVGQTNDVLSRFKKHNSGHIQSTKSFIPAKLKGYFAVETKQKAIELEKYFKTGSGKAFLKKRLILY